MKTKKIKIKQQIVATLVVAFMFVMVSGTFNIPGLLAATSNSVNLIVNVVQGSLNMDSQFNVNFDPITVGVAANSLGNLTMVNMQDYRGNGAGWSVTGYMNNLAVAAAGVNNFSNAIVWWVPGSVAALAGSATGVTAGSTMNFFDAERTLVSSTTNNGMGSYRLSNTVMNIVYNGRPDQQYGTYQAVLTLQIQ